MLFNRKERAVPSNAVYIGRPGPWGNPFSIGKDGDRLTVISKYREWLQAQPALIERMKTELSGRPLVCWCYPLPCHGEVILDALSGTSTFCATTQEAPTQGRLF